MRRAVPRRDMSITRGAGLISALCVECPLPYVTRHIAEPLWCITATFRAHRPRTITATPISFIIHHRITTVHPSAAPRILHISACASRRVFPLRLRWEVNLCSHLSPRPQRKAARLRPINAVDWVSVSVRLTPITVCPYFRRTAHSRVHTSSILFHGDLTLIHLK